MNEIHKKVRQYYTVKFEPDEDICPTRVDLELFACALMRRISKLPDTTCLYKTDLVLDSEEFVALTLSFMITGKVILERGQFEIVLERALSICELNNKLKYYTLETPKYSLENPDPFYLLN